MNMAVSPANKCVLQYGGSHGTAKDLLVCQNTCHDLSFQLVKPKCRASEAVHNYQQQNFVIFSGGLFFLFYFGLFLALFFKFGMKICFSMCVYGSSVLC